MKEAAVAMAKEARSARASRRPSRRRGGSSSSRMKPAVSGLKSQRPKRSDADTRTRPQHSQTPASFFGDRQTAQFLLARQYDFDALKLEMKKQIVQNEEFLNQISVLEEENLLLREQLNQNGIRPRYKLKDENAAFTENYDVEC